MARIHFVTVVIVVFILIAFTFYVEKSNTIGETSLAVTTVGPTTVLTSVSLSSSTMITFTTKSEVTTLQSLSNGECVSVGGLPDPICTPGAVNSDVNQNNIYSTICVSGWASIVRPNETYTEDLKEKQIYYYNYTDKSLSDYEEDHLVPLEVGGSPTSPLNLWPEPHYGNYSSYDKDALENYVNAQVCDGKMTLAQGQAIFLTNWVKYWVMYLNQSSTTANGD